MTVDIHTGEVVAHMSAASARTLTDEIRATLTTAHDKLLDAWKGRADLALGYDSWDAYCAGEFAGQRMVRLDREQRREIVAAMRTQGMSTRAIGSALGVHHGTAAEDVRATVGNPTDRKVTSLDGRLRPASQPPRQPEPEVVDADVVEDQPETPRPVLTEEERIRLRDEREREAATRRYVDSIKSFLHGWTTAYHLRGDANRDTVLAALDPFDRDRFLRIEKETTWPSTRI